MTRARAGLHPLPHLLTPTALAALALIAGACGSSGGAKTSDGGTDAGDANGSTDSGADTAPSDGGADTVAACTAGGTGTLVVAVQGLPAEATPMVRVAGGGLASPMMVAAGAPVTLAAGGGYEIDYRRVKVAPAAGGIVGKAFYVSASSFDGCVRPTATTTATLTYTQEPGSEHLWATVSDAPTLGDEIAGFASADLGVTAAKNPAVWKTKNFTGRGAAGAFDSSGNLWVPGGDVINMYPMMTLATAGDAPPAVVLTQPASAPALFAAFDGSGNLWVSRGAPASTIVRYSLADQAASGSPTPAVVITSPDLVNPAGLAFDASGDLWVASEGKDEVLVFRHNNLVTSYAGAADGVLTAKTAATAPVQATYTAPNGLAFDQAGNLWVGFESTLVAFTPAQQGTPTLVVGPVALNVSTGTGGFAFDESGGLWTVGDSPSTFRRFPKTALATTGDATPDIVIASSELGYAETLVLDPAPTWSPIQDQL